MAITTTEYAEFTNKAFFDNREWLNQENWQMYFGGSLPSGVLVKGRLESTGIDYTSALSRQLVSSSYIQFRAGSVLANGIFASYSGGTSIPTVKSGDVDRLFVARVALTGGNVKIVGMTKVAAEYGYTPAVFARMLLQDESLACTRNATYYDIPLLYEIFGGDAYDLRRLIYLAGQSPDVDISYKRSEVTNTSTIPGILYGRDFVQTYGGMNYNVTFVSDDSSTSFYVYPNPSCSEKHTVVKLVNNSSTTKQIRIPLLFKSLTFSYSWLESWDVDANSRYLYKELVAGDKMTLVLTPNGHDSAFEYTVTNKSSATGGGGIDPEDYFTKQEISAMMLLKANVSDMNSALALKENIANLGDLAYLNTANYVTQITNKPTLGALASKDKVNVASQVTGILPISNGGTGASDLAGIIANVIGTNIVYFVDSINGNDNNDGKTYENSFKTIQHAIDSCPFIADCKIVLESGTYSESTIIVPYGKRIEIASYRNNVSITISPTNVNDTAIIVDGGILKFSSWRWDSNNHTYTLNLISSPLPTSTAENSVVVVNNGQLYCTIPTTIINQNSNTVNNSECMFVYNNSYISFDNLTLNATGDSSGQRKKASGLYMIKSRGNISTLTTVANNGISCNNSMLHIDNSTITSDSTAFIVRNGSILTYNSHSGTSTKSIEGNSRINWSAS